MWRRQRRSESDFDHEIQAHLSLEVDRLVASGMSRDEARRAAARKFGNVTGAEERFYESRRVRWLDAIWQDARLAQRSLIRSPGLAFVVILTLGLGIGATTAIVSTVDAVLLRPLPYADPDRLVTVWEDYSAGGFPRNTPAPANFLDWQARNRVFAGMAATFPARATLTGDGAPEQVLGRRVTANFFQLLGVQPLRGRTFTEEEDRQSAPVVLIGEGLWRRRYLGDPAIVGRTITVNAAAVTVIGVMPESFVFRDREMEFWSPIAFTPQQRALRTVHVLNVVARLAPGIGIEQARQDMDQIARQLQAEHAANDRVGVALVPMREEVLGTTQPALMVLAGAAACMGIMMCFNLASLLLARATAKRREMATRVALGADRPRLITQTLVEGLLWALAGAGCGFVVASLGIRVLGFLVPTTLAESVGPTIDARLLAFLCVLSVLVGSAFSILPAIHAHRVAPQDALKVGRAVVGSHHGIRSALVTVQVAMTFALLVAAVLMLQSFVRLRSVDVGFQPAGVVTARITVPDARYDNAQRQAFYERAMDGVRAIPGVGGVAFTSTLPFASRGNTAGYRLEGRPLDIGDPGEALFRVTTPDYLRTVGVQLVDGRLPTTADGLETPPVTVINESFAKRYWPTERAVGHRIALNNPDAEWMTIIGVVADVFETGYEVTVRPGMYVLASQLGAPADNLVVRVAGEPLAVLPGIRRVIAQVDPLLPVSAVQTLDELIDLEIVDRRQQAVILTAFAVAALLLAALGLYGLISHVVSERRRELGLRLALGATPSAIVRSVVRGGLLCAALGLVFGAVAAFVGARAMQGLLYETRFDDLLTFAAVGVFLIMLCAFASWLPARAIVLTSPMVALRQE